MFNEQKIIELRDNVRRGGGVAEVCVLHPTDHVYRLDRVKTMAGLTMEPRSYATPGSLLVTSRAELAKHDEAVTCWRFTATPSDFRQAYFTTPPVRPDGTCGYFIDHITRKAEPRITMTYAELKTALEALTPEQLTQQVIWCGEDRGGKVNFLHVEPEDLVGDPSDYETWVPRSDVGTAVDAEDYADAKVCVPKGRVSLDVG